MFVHVLSIQYKGCLARVVRRMSALGPMDRITIGNISLRSSQFRHGLQPFRHGVFGELEVVSCLKIEPIPWRLSESTSEQQSQLSRDRPRAFDYVGDTHRRHIYDSR